MAIDLGTLSPSSAVTAIYIGFFNRAPDPVGLAFWEGVIEMTSLDLVAITSDFANQPETQALFPIFADPTSTTSNAFVIQLFNNLFNRDPDQAGLDFWTAAVDASLAGAEGSISIGEIVTSVIEGAQSVEDGGFPDDTTVLNKVEVGLDWVTSFAETGAEFELAGASGDSARAVIDPVDETAQSVTDAMAVTDAFIATIDTTPPGVPGDELFLTSDTDVLTGTENDDEFNAFIAQNPFAGGVSNTLSSADRIDGGAGNDSLYAEVTGEFVGVVGNVANIDIQPRLSNIEEIDIEARESDFAGQLPNFGADITIDAKNITDHVRIGSFESDGDLRIENVTTLLSNGAARNTSELTISMDHTDNFNSDGDASDLTVLFDNDYLLAGETSVGQADFFLLDQDAELRIADGDPAEGRLDEIGNNGIRFEIGGNEIEVTFDGALLEEDAPNEINDHDAFIAALQADLAAQIAAGDIPAGTQIIRFDRDEVIFDDDGLALNQAALQDGSFSDLIPAIRVISGDGSPVTPLGFTVPSEDQNPFNVFGRVTSDFEADDDPISINIDLEKVGRGGEGGDLIVGGKAQNVNEGIAGGIEVFNISVKGIGGDGAFAKPSNVGTITSTLNALTTVNIVTDAAFAGGDSFASLVIRDGFDQNVGVDGGGGLFGEGPGRGETGDLQTVNANGFLGNLTLGDGDPTSFSNDGVITNLDTLTALGGGDITLNAELDGTETNQNYTYTTGSGDDTLNIEVDGDALDFADSGLRVATGAGDDVVNVDFDFDIEDNSNNQLNQAIIDDVVIETGSGNDSITVDGVGVANILAGSGNDFINTSGGGNAIWAFNFDNARADDQGLSFISADDLPGVQTSLAYVGGAEITVTLSGAGIGADFSAGGGLMAVGADGAVAFDDGYESTVTITNLINGNDFYGDQRDVNEAILRAINDDPVLSQLLTASISSNNTLLVVSNTGGDFDPTDLRIDIAQDATADFTDVEDEAQVVFVDSTITVSDLDEADGVTALPLLVDANAWYDGLSIEAGPNAADDNLHTTGFADGSENDNVINGGSGDDVIVLSTDADGFTPSDLTLSSQNALINGASNETVVLTGSDIGNDTVMNFTDDGAEDGVDFLDFTFYLTSQESPSGSTQSQFVTPVTLSADTDATANEVIITSYDEDDDDADGDTFASLSAADIEALYNDDTSIDNLVGGDFEQDEDADVIGDGKAVLLVENENNDGEYKVFELTWDATPGDDEDLSAVLLGSLDFGDSLDAIDEVNLVGSDAFAALDLTAPAP